jgi:hypothetical protein
MSVAHGERHCRRALAAYAAACAGSRRHALRQRCRSEWRGGGGACDAGRTALTAAKLPLDSAASTSASCAAVSVCSQRSSSPPSPCTVIIRLAVLNERDPAVQAASQSGPACSTITAPGTQACVLTNTATAAIMLSATVCTWLEETFVRAPRASVASCSPQKSGWWRGQVRSPPCQLCPSSTSGCRRGHVSSSGRAAVSGCSGAAALPCRASQQGADVRFGTQRRLDAVTGGTARAACRAFQASMPGSVGCRIDRRRQTVRAARKRGRVAQTRAGGRWTPQARPHAVGHGLKPPRLLQR